MENELIYLEGKSEPFTKEQLAEIIMQEAMGKDEIPFAFFKDEYESVGFKYLDKTKKQERLLADFAILESEFKQNEAWKDPGQISSYISKGVVPLHRDEANKLVIPERIFKIEIENAVKLKLALRKKEHFESILEDLSKEILPGTRIKWIRTASEFGIIMLTLQKKGYLELPNGRGSEESYELFAKTLLNSFNIDAAWPTIKDALNPNKNNLSNTKRTKLEDYPTSCPDADELGAIKKRKIK